VRCAEILVASERSLISQAVRSEWLPRRLLIRDRRNGLPPRSSLPPAVIRTMWFRHLPRCRANRQACVPDLRSSCRHHRPEHRRSESPDPPWFRVDQPRARLLRNGQCASVSGSVSRARCGPVRTREARAGCETRRAASLNTTVTESPPTVCWTLSEKRSAAAREWRRRRGPPRPR